MIKFVLERTGETIPAQLQWMPNGKTGELYIRARNKLTEVGDLLSNQSTGEQFILGDHNFNGLFFKGRRHYSVGCFKVTDTIGVWRQGGLLSGDLRAVVDAGAPWAEEMPCRLIEGQELHVSIQPTDIQKGDDIIVARTGTLMKVETVDAETWGGKLILVYGTVWR